MALPGYVCADRMGGRSSVTSARLALRNTLRAICAEMRAGWHRGSAREERLVGRRYIRRIGVRGTWVITSGAPAVIMTCSPRDMVSWVS